MHLTSTTVDKRKPAVVRSQYSEGCAGRDMGAREHAKPIRAVDTHGEGGGFVPVLPVRGLVK